MKRYIKMNESNDYLSFGNLCRIIKEVSINKTFSSQSEIFSIIFNDDCLSDSTVNNYCIGYRNIGSNHKKKYYKYKKEYNNDNKLILIELISNLIYILECNINEINTYEKINNNKLLKELCNKLYNIAKNDKNVSSEFTVKIYNYIKTNKLYECIVELLFYIILEHKQPIYKENIIKETIENILTKTNISVNDLEKFLSLNFKDGVNYTYELKQLVKENNAYACFEMGYMEYKGEITGEPRYNTAYKYFMKAASYNHPRANLLMADMLLKGQVGNKSEEDKEKAIEYLNKAVSFGSVAALNKLGLIYLTIDKEKAIKYFEKAAKGEYVYAYNNLGKIYEEGNNYEKAFEYYLKSAEKEESWACNRLGEFYRLGICVEKNMEKAYYYYNLATNVPVKLLEYYSKYNLAKYFYLCGNYELGIDKDESKAISLFEEASQNNKIEASIELLKIYIKKYLTNQNENYKEKIYYYKKRIENHEKYNNKIKESINNELSKIEI